MDHHLKAVKEQWILSEASQDKRLILNKSQPRSNLIDPNKTAIYQEAIQEYRPIWKQLLKQEELLSMNDWESLFKIIKLLKQNFVHEVKSNYLRFLEFDLVDYRQRVEEMGGEITAEDKEKFSQKIQRLLKRDRRRKARRRKNKTLENPANNYRINPLFKLKVFQNNE